MYNSSHYISKTIDQYKRKIYKQLKKEGPNHCLHFNKI